MTPCTAKQLLHYTRVGWPVCCKEVMALFEPAEKRPADGAALDDTPPGGTKAE